VKAAIGCEDRADDAYDHQLVCEDKDYFPEADFRADQEINLKLCVGS
jgi:hypothetical protein